MTDDILKSHGEQIDFIAKKVLEHDEQLQWLRENTATKADLRDISDTLDKLVGLAQKKDQELTFINSRVSRVEEQTNQNTEDLKKMKPALGLS
jgi:hypothetical protein